MQQELEQFCRDNKGRFSERDIPPCKPIKVYLPDPLIRALDEYGKKNGTGRGKSLISLLEGILDTPEEPETPDKADKTWPKMIFFGWANGLECTAITRTIVAPKGGISQITPSK